MNVYDFDHTIYDGDSTLDFWKYCVRRYPMALRPFPKAIWYAILFKLRLCEREQFKEKFYEFLQYVPDVQLNVKDFWVCNEKKIKEFYLRQSRPDDLIISASPDFLIGEVCRKLGVHSIASKVDPLTGKLDGPNCRGSEKVRRFYEEHLTGQIGEFYSDSISDLPLAMIADKAYLIQKDSIKEWNR